MVPSSIPSCDVHLFVAIANDKEKALFRVLVDIEQKHGRFKPKNTLRSAGPSQATSCRDSARSLYRVGNLGDLRKCRKADPFGCERAMVFRFRRQRGVDGP